MVAEYVRLVRYQFAHSRYVYPKAYYAVAPVDGWGTFLTVGSTWRLAARAGNRTLTWQGIIITQSEPLTWLPRFPQLAVQYLRPDKLSQAAAKQWKIYAQQHHYDYVVPCVSANRYQWNRVRGLSGLNQGKDR